MSEHLSKALDRAYDKNKFRALCEAYAFEGIIKDWHNFQKRYDLKCRWKNKDFIPLSFCKSSFLKKAFPRIAFKEGGFIKKLACRSMSEYFVIRDGSIQINQDYKSVNQKTDLIHIICVVFYLSDQGKRYVQNGVLTKKPPKPKISLEEFSDSVIEDLQEGNLNEKPVVNEDNSDGTENYDYDDEDMSEAERELDEADNLTQLTDSDIEALSKRHDDDYVNDKIKII